MRRLIDLIGRLWRDERGNFAIIFALMAIVLVAMSGAVVDFTSVQQARTKAQVALDAASLALQPSIYNTGITAATITSEAEALLLNRLSDGAHQWGDCTTGGANIIVSTPPCVTMGTTQIDTTAGTLSLTANLDLPMNFVSLVGIASMQAQIISVATRQKLNLEVAMVLDNSGSMNFTMGYNSNIGGGLPTRMDTLHGAATCAVNILFYSVTTCSAATTGLTQNPDTEIGIVPFTQEVNVGYSLPAADLDLAGTTAGSVTVDNFDYTGSIPGDAGISGVNRVALFSEMKDNSGNTMSWEGCVQARAAPYDTTDDPPTASTPATLYTPFFAVDEPDGSSGGPFYNNYISDEGPACAISSTCTITTVTTTSGWRTRSSVTDSLVASDGETSSSCSCAGYPTTTTTSASGGTTTVKQTCSPPFQPANLTPQQYQDRLCKYQGAQMTAAPNPPYVFGPNGDCPAARVQPLNADPSTIISAITAMQATGGTNITEGAVWGLRLLSPNDPFDALPFNAATSKVLIIMTDGENTIYPGTNMNDDDYNSAYGFPINGRLLPTSDGAAELQSWQDMQAEMDNRLVTVCTDAKNEGITIYTIGIDVADSGDDASDSAANQVRLTNCASTASDAYFPDTASDLQSAFVSIANQLAALRLSK